MSKKVSKAQVIVPPKHSIQPEPHEIAVAEILAAHYNAVVEFIVPVNDYKRKSVDIMMNGALWEIKSPTGKSRKHTVKYQFDRATGQNARGLVFDGRRTSLPDEFLTRTIKFELSRRRRVKKVVFITKTAKIVEFS
jgi:hypothetical protein